MKLQTRVFGEIGIDENKVITFPKGIIGFPDLKKFLLITEENEKEEKPSLISWLQSIDEPEIALPVMDPLVVAPAYAPTVREEYFDPLEDMRSEEFFILVTVTVTQQMEDMSVNLKAPVIINTEKRIAEQVIIENGEYSVKHPIYSVLQQAKGVD